VKSTQAKNPNAVQSKGWGSEPVKKGFEPRNVETASMLALQIW